MKVVRIVPEHSWEYYEKFYIAYYRKLGYILTNSCLGGGGLLSPSEEIRKKISDAKLGKKRPPRSEESIRKQSESMRGKKFSEEHKAKISASSIGKSKSKEAIEKSASSRTGMKHSSEHKAKISARLVGNHYRLGYKESPENVEKAVESRKRNRLLRLQQGEDMLLVKDGV